MGNERTTTPAGGQSYGRKRQADIFLGDLRGKKPAVPVDYRRLREKARNRMSAEAYAYVAGGAGAETTMEANREAFRRCRLRPRMLRDVSAVDTSTALFGRSLPSPLILAPIGVLEMAHREADLGVGRAAAAEGIPFIFSSQASVAMETCARAMGKAPRWFQLYWSKNDELVRSFVKRAEDCGCEAIVLTLDTTLLGWRPRDLDLAYLPFLRARGIAQYTSDPVFRQMMKTPSTGGQGNDKKNISLNAIRALIEMSRNYPGPFLKNLVSGKPRQAVQTFINTYSRPSLTWDNLSFLRDLTSLPLLLKGITHPDDARRAQQAGMDGVIVSNHGGRQVDGAVPALEALPGVVDAVGPDFPVLFDSGIRTGADIVKALALGAHAVLLGRPYVYGLALAGEDGVREVIRNYRASLELTMGLCGVPAVSRISSDILNFERGRFL